MTIDEFAELMKEMARRKAVEKGYNTGETDAGKLPLDFVLLIGNGPAHPLGEIALKALRYSRTHKLEDLVKIATWAYLLADKHVSEVKREP